jgi:adenylate cyclase
MKAAAIRPIADWLIDGARSAATPDEVLAVLCERLVTAGIPLWRAAVFVRTLHPQVVGRRFVWRAGQGVEIAQEPYGVFNDSDFTGGILTRLFNDGLPARLRLDDGADLAGAPLLAELRQQGATEFVALPLVFTDGTIHAATWTTRRKGGFSAAELAGIEAILRPLARMTEIWGLRRTASNLLDTYVGHVTGERILDGQIRRGDVQTIEAAIWLSDMRGFTALADRLPMHELIGHLNRYFDCQIPAIEAYGGEVLKFMGDGLLAIFPIADGIAADSCANALAAAEITRANIAALRSPADVAGRSEVRFGLTLHMGQVQYGNIGGGNRLDFTCIGPAVNLAARIEKLASRLGRDILVSQPVARCCGRR